MGFEFFQICLDIADVGVRLGASLGEEEVFDAAFVTVPNRENAKDAIANLCSLSHAYGADSDPWPAFFDSAATDCCAPVEVMAATLRDLADEDVVDEMLGSVLGFLLLWQSVCSDAGSSLADEPRLAPYCLGVVRRQLCSGDRGKSDVGYVQVASMAFRALRSVLPCMGQLCYAKVALLALD